MAASLIIPGLADPQEALPTLVLQSLPTGLVGLVIAALISAIMSTASGTIMALSTIIVNDFIFPFGKVKGNDKKKVTVTRITTLFMGIVAIFIATVLQNIVVALDVAYALLSGSIFLPIIAALFWKKISKNVILLSMLVSSIAVVLDLIFEGIESLNAIIYGLVSGILVIIVGPIIMKVTQTKSPEEKDQTIG